MTEAEIKKLRVRAHEHSEHCYGRYESCGEHHAHDDMCGGRSLVCQWREDKDLVQLLAEFDRTREALKETLDMLDGGRIYTTLERVAALRVMFDMGKR